MVGADSVPVAGPFEEALPAAYPVIAPAHVLAQCVYGEFLFGVEVGVHVLRDPRVDPNIANVSHSQRAERGEAQAEAVSYRVVHVLGVGNPTGHQFDGLTSERVLKPIGNEAGNVQIHPDRRFANRLQSGECAVHAVRVAVGVPDHLDQREDVGRKQEVGAHHAARIFTDRRQLAGWEAGGVAGEDGR